ncbi:hypothetical protein EJ05DRAFT_195030 [Pseudovirgaria hyperparasitica]|uniref:alpha-galactosidase n=1 Tax=Pseudovirgaria hyperparasitica TaxID=470096 RepID=A0A6A6WIF6_9PEZI|nr:uncharacterized protein EJ05DRAFT_195030 [Pseudovirgaria hyperparasitica]KAF2762039.1 hypothetical protein EJ05DRAFT_195030 [Pseudovirgaria hyperparasitica]
MNPPPLPPRPIWQPTPGTTWNYILNTTLRIDPSISHHSVYIIDLFDNDAAKVAHLHALGRKVIAYFSAGTYEDWRPDAAHFPKCDLGCKMDDWEGEKWVQTSSGKIRDIMRARIDLARAKGFDGVDPDNVDAYDNKNGLKLSKADAIDYVRFLAQEAHARGLACGLKNAGDIVPTVVRDVEYCVQEQCVEFDDVDMFVPFIEHGKPVFHVEYPKGDDPDSKKMNNDRDVSPKQRDKAFKARSKGFSTIIKNVKLDQWIQVS